MGRGSYEVEAFNTATASTNRIHDDEVAQRFGFAGGLVPGVDVYAYLCHLPAEAWGERWLAGGTMTARFRSPVYDGDRVQVTALPAADESDDGVGGNGGDQGEGDQREGDGLDLEVRDSSGVVCAVGRATLHADDGPAPDPDDWPAGAPPDPDDRPPATAEVLRAAEPGAVAATFRADHAAPYLDDVREGLPLFRDHDRAVAHPGWLLRFANTILVANVALGPWIHTGSTVRFLGLVRDGDRVETRARVAEVRERGGHEYVDLDVVQHVAGRPVARIAHTAIFRLRDSDAR